MASTIKIEDFTTNLFFILEETFAGSHRDGNAYLDKGTGWFHTLRSITAEQASVPIAPGGTSIAGQVAHTKFYLEALEGFMTGRLTGKVAWQESWSVQAVDARAWQGLKNDFEAAYERVRLLLKSYTDWDDDRVGDAFSILTHSAYHLGAVRQIVRSVSRPNDLDSESRR